MWNTSKGTRILVGAERKLFISGVGSLLDHLEDGGKVDVPVFEHLDHRDKIFAIAIVTKALLDKTVSPPDKVAWNESTIYAVFDFIKSLVCCEVDYGDNIDDAKFRYYWRNMILKVCKQKEIETDLTKETDDEDAWMDCLDEIADEILFDRDWELVNTPGFLDQSPEAFVKICDQAGIADDYFIATCPNPKGDGDDVNDAARYIMSLDKTRIKKD